MKKISLKKSAITTLFIDIGGVLLSNGWDENSRKLVANQFELDFDEMEARHQQTFDTYELGKIDLKEYLQRVVFYRKRPFTPTQFKTHMLAQSQPYPEMLALMRRLKAQYGLKIVVISNEARELNAYRIKKFKLANFVDVFISSCFVHLRKPDADMFHLAVDLAQTPKEQIIYIEDRPMFVTVAEQLGIKSIHHIDYPLTYKKLAKFGLQGKSL